MLYQRQTFTCPAAGAKTSGENWDRAFLTHEEFVAKYGEVVHPHPVTHKGHNEPHVDCLECASGTDNP